MMKWFSDHHVWTKLLALVLAIALWAVVISMDNPERRMEIGDVPVQLIGENQISSANSLVVTDISDEDISVRLQGTFSNLGKIDKDNIIVRADVSNFTVPGTFYLEYDVSTPVGITYLGGSPARIQVTLDQMIEKELEVRIEYDGQLEEGLEIVKRQVQEAFPDYTLSIIADVDISD